MRKFRIRRTIIAVGVLFVVISGFGLVAAMSALGAQERLETARQAIERGRSALLEGNSTQAMKTFLKAQTSLVGARERLSTPMITVLGFLPVLGRTVDATRLLADAGLQVARAGELLASSARDLPGGITSFVPRNGVIPLEPFHQLESPFREAEELIASARTLLGAVPDSLLLGQVEAAREEFEHELAVADRAVSSAVTLSRALPAFLGETGARRYFFGAQNPAELRGTGGYIGAYAIMTVRNGRVSLSPFASTETLDNVPPSKVQAPNPSYAVRYDRYGGAGFWPNINLTPDFPSAAVAIERLYEETTGERVDGTIVANPQALAALLETTGPVGVPGTATSVDSETLVPFVTNEAYETIDDSEARKRLLGDAARAVLGAFLDGGLGDVTSAGRAVAEAAAGGHLLLHASDPELQETFEEVGVAGELGGSGTDFLGVIGNSAAGNKVDFYARRTVRHSVSLTAEGGATSRTLVSITNGAPDTGQPAYVIGPYPPLSKAGENITYLSAFCGSPCSLTRFVQGGNESMPASEVEIGFPVYSTTIRLPSGESKSAAFSWQIHDAWAGTRDRGSYRLVFRDQPTIHATRLTLEVTSPPSTHITHTQPKMEVTDDRAVWEGASGTEAVFEVEFEAPFISRIWRSILRFLSGPIFG